MRNLWAFSLLLLLGHLLAPAAAAHPLGNFTINHFSRLRLAPAGVELRQILDMAEIPAFQEIGTIDRNGNERADPEEAAGYPDERCGAIAGDLSLRVDGRPVALRLAGASVSFPPGAGGLPTLRLVCDFTAPAGLGAGEAAVEFTNNSYAERQGWREIVVAAEGLRLSGAAAQASSSAELTSYPTDLLSAPLDQRAVSFRVSPAGAGPAEPAAQGQPAPAGAPGARGDAFTELILVEQWTPLTLLAALGVAFVWGAAHALSPGHGKTVVAAYLVGARGTVQHALFLGLTTTITHTAGVFALGLITLFAAQWVVPEQLFPWLSLISGLLVVGIGARMLWERGRGLWGHGGTGTRGHGDTGAGIAAHLHDHDHDHDHQHQHQHIHSHHDHDHQHMHSHHDHDHHAHAAPGSSALSPQPSALDHSHSHLPPGAAGERVTWRGLLALGVSGGLLPCPSALVVLLSAIALGKVGLGLLLVLAFSLGLAGLLTAIGVAFVYAGRLFARVPTRGRLFALLPALSAAFIVLIGLGISAKAILEVGLL